MRASPAATCSSLCAVASAYQSLAEQLQGSHTLRTTLADTRRCRTVVRDTTECRHLVCIGGLLRTRSVVYGRIKLLQGVPFALGETSVPNSASVPEGIGVGRCWKWRHVAESLGAVELLSENLGKEGRGNLRSL